MNIPRFHNIVFFYDLSSKLYFHSNFLYYYRQVNQKHLPKFKRRGIDSPWFDDLIVQLWNIKSQEILYQQELRFANNLPFVTVTAPHTYHFSKEFPRGSSFLHNSGKSIGSLSTKSNTSTIETRGQSVKFSIFNIITFGPKTCQLKSFFTLCIQQRYGRSALC